MKCTITINMDNAAFEDSGELARVLHELADNIYFSFDLPDGEPHGGDLFRVRDASGNRVGEALITE